jgi:purine-binding chemotaxis protein CheW
MESPTYTTFQVGEYWVGVDSRRVQEVLRGEEPTEVPLAHPALRGLINVRGQIVPVVDLRARFGLLPTSRATSIACLLARATSGPVALVVDWSSDLIGIEAETISAVPENVPKLVRGFFQGAYRVGDRLLFELDLDRTVEL